jgi:DNA (cytosine-5)-methyltransferase 1
MTSDQARPTAISLFAGAGGLDIGLEQAGFEAVTVTDFDKWCCASLRENQARGIPIPDDLGGKYLEHARIIEAPVQELTAQDLWSRKGHPTVMVGGPPCQPFSSAGAQRGLTDARGTLFAEFVRLAGELQPSYVLFENVRGLITQRGANGVPGEALNLVRSAFEEAGYATSFQLIRTADYGLPQRRVRLFMFGARDGVMPEFPEPTHARDGGRNPLKPWVTLGDFLAERDEPHEDDTRRPTAKMKPLLEALQPGSGLKSPGRPEPTRPNGHWGYKQGTFVANPKLPSRTVTAASTQDWWKLPDGSVRRLTAPECAGLQSFPPEWQLAGPMTAQYRQIGNAVPPPIAKIMAAEILKAAGKTDGPRGPIPFPEEFRAAIAYTKRDSARNASARPRLNRDTEMKET